MFINKERKHKIVKAAKNGPAARVGIKAGDYLVSIDGESIMDVFDYRMAAASVKPALEIETAHTGIRNIVEIAKEEYEDLGLEFENPLMDEVRKCRNKCIFCFIDQLPEGMRDAVYFKDDDFRLSFLEGNYISLTNLTAADADRIIKYRLSPMNISVHATNPKLRCEMMGNPNAGDVLKHIKRFTEEGITVNCQIVLCRGLNDRAELKRTLGELTAFCPGVHSISIVPVGLTAHRGGLTQLTPFDRESSAAVLKEAMAWQDKMMREHGSSVVYPADEFYMMAEKPMPEHGFYEDYPQLENGVGMTALLNHEFNSEMKKVLKYELKGARRVSVATGWLAYANIRRMADDISRVFSGKLKVDVYAIENIFFGSAVTVSGLVTGGDIARQLAGKNLGDVLLIPGNMTRFGDEVFLDGYTVQALSGQLGCNITPVRNTGRDFIKAVLGAK